MTELRRLSFEDILLQHEEPDEDIVGQIPAIIGFLNLD